MATDTKGDKVAELVASLREAADKIEAAGSVEGNGHPAVKLSIHHVTIREELAHWVRLIEHAEPVSYDGATWVQGEIAGCSASVFYTPGLLGKTKRERIVVTEDEPDLQGLLEASDG